MAARHWSQSLAANHTQPQALPGETVVCTWACGGKGPDEPDAPKGGCAGKHDCRCNAKQREACRPVTETISTEGEMRRFAVPDAPREIEPLHLSQAGRPDVIILRNFDGRHGLGFAESYEGLFGCGILGGHGTANKCSKALQHPKRKECDFGNGDTCSHFNDGFHKLFPLMGEKHGGNFGECGGEAAFQHKTENTCAQ